ncbi:MAG: hypothetical protein ACLRWP_13780 [Bilophila wadsworthia]
MLAVAMRCPNVYLMPDCYLYIPGWPYARDYVKAANSYLKYRTPASAYPAWLRAVLQGWCAGLSIRRPESQPVTAPPGFGYNGTLGTCRGNLLKKGPSPDRPKTFDGEAARE